MDALSGLLVLPEYAPCLTRDPFLQGLKERIDRNKGLKVLDEEAFNSLIDEVIVELAKEAKRRRIGR